MTLKEKIDFYASQFESKTREDGTNYVVMAKETPELYKAVKKAHGDRFPDDFIYSTFSSILDTLSDYDIEDQEDIDNYMNEIINSQVDVYTSGLTKWLNSDNRNVYYLTQAIDEFQPQDGFQALSIAQSIQIQEVFDEVQNLLQQE